MTTLKMLVSTLLMAGCMGALASGNLSGLDLRAYQEGIDRADRDAGPKVRAMIVCATGYSTSEHGHPVPACHQSYEFAMAEKDYESAMYYVALGCGKYRNVGLCRHAARLPVVLGWQGVAVPDSFRGDLKRVAEKVCFSGMRIKAGSGADVTARECANFARLFNLAKDPEYLIAPEPAVTRILEALHDSAFAGKLHAAACERLGAADSCELARGLGAPDRQAGARDGRASVGLTTRQKE